MHIKKKKNIILNVVERNMKLKAADAKLKPIWKKYNHVTSWEQLNPSVVYFPAVVAISIQF